MRRTLFRAVVVVTLTALLLAPAASAAPRLRSAESTWTSLWSWVSSWFGKVAPPLTPPASPGEQTDAGPDWDPWG